MRKKVDWSYWPKATLAGRRPVANPRRSSGRRRQKHFPPCIPNLYIGASKDGEPPMAMTMNGQVQLPASRDVVWAKLNDPEVLKSCIPGSAQLDKISDSEFQPIATV